MLTATRFPAVRSLSMRTVLIRPSFFVWLAKPGVRRISSVLLCSIDWRNKFYFRTSDLSRPYRHFDEDLQNSFFQLLDVLRISTIAQMVNREVRDLEAQKLIDAFFEGQSIGQLEWKTNDMMTLIDSREHPQSSAALFARPFQLVDDEMSPEMYICTCQRRECLDEELENYLLISFAEGHIHGSTNETLSVVSIDHKITRWDSFLSWQTWTLPDQCHRQIGEDSHCRSRWSKCTIENEPSLLFSSLLSFVVLSDVQSSEQR